ncbi:MAG: segregation/condensation protein A [Treponema sp.]|nr:segregation/condensation protein A [Treponema sp.]
MVFMEKRKFSAGQFDGPLDLLWALIKENKVDIYDIPIAEITEQFLDYLDYASSVDLGDLSDFYRMASKLLHIKSRMMLPVEPDLDDEFDFDDPREDLVDSLIEYQRFKQLSSLMETKEDESEWNFERKRIKRKLPANENQDDVWKKIDTAELLDQMQHIFKKLMTDFSDSKILDMYEEISVNEKLTLIEEFFSKKEEFMFTDLIVRKGNQLDLVCAFMAILEAVKFKMAAIYQNRMFGDIKIRKFQSAPND